MTESRDIADLKVEIRKVVRGPEADDAERLRLIARAADLKHEGLLPDNWERSNGSLIEKRDTANDVFTALDGAIADAYADDYYTYVIDWDSPNGDDCRVIYYAGGDVMGAPFSWTDDNQVVVDIESAEKVRPITMYVGRAQRNRALPPKVDAEMRAAREDMRGLREVRRMPVEALEMREVPNGTGGTQLVCTGYASVTCASREDSSNSYTMEDPWGEYEESTIRGFASKTIREGCDTVFWPNHGDGALPMARTKASSLVLSEDLTGLHYEARLNPDRADVQVLRAAIDDGTITESSFAFRVIRQQWNKEYTQRWITEVSLDRGDVSPVTFGANPRTGDYPLSMRSAMTVLRSQGIDFRSFALSLREMRSGSVSASSRDLVSMMLRELRAEGDEPEDLDELLGGTSVRPPDPEPSRDGGAAVIPLVVPDHTQSARAMLARYQTRSGR